MSYILTLNAGSSSLKFSVYEADEDGVGALELSGQWSGIGSRPKFSAKRGSEPYDGALPGGSPPKAPCDALQSVLRWISNQGIQLADIAGTSHRIVHGGTDFKSPCIINDSGVSALHKLKRLAPLHMPHGLAVLENIREQLPNIPHVACFDTAFHATQPDEATRLPLPQAFHDKGYRRYGFHGLNYEHIVYELPDLTGHPLPERLLVYHLGNGASACAILNGQSVATTMGYTPLDGLIMGTRTGSLDPGIVLALARDEGMSIDALEALLYKQSGLLGLSGRSSDMQTLLAAEDEASERAINHFCYWAARHGGSLITAMGGLDAIVFTGGIGENAVAVREKIIRHWNWLGAAIDDQRNAANETELSRENSWLKIWRAPANEEVQLARHAARLIF